MADAGVGDDDRVVDPGAGTGVLTAALAARAPAVLAVELDPALAEGLARRFGAGSNVTVLHADVRDVPLPRNPYRVVANSPFGHTAAILHRLLDDPGAPLDLLGAIWAPWWRFERGRRIPAGLFRPRAAVDAAVLVVSRRDPPLVPIGEFARHAALVTTRWPLAGLHSRGESANMG